MLTAGAGGTQFGVLTSCDQGGGNKKQGLVSTTNTRVGLDARIRVRGGGHNRNWLSRANQLGGVGRRWGQSSGPGNRGGISANVQRLAYRRRRQYPRKPCGAQTRGWGPGTKFKPLCNAEDPPPAQERWACECPDGCYQADPSEQRGIVGPAGFGPNSAAELCTRVCGTQTKAGLLCPCSSDAPGVADPECRTCTRLGYKMSEDLSGACVPCEPGQYGIPAVRDPNTGAVVSRAECRPCPTCQYNPDYGQGACKWCPSGTGTAAEGTKNQSDCKSGLACPVYGCNPATGKCEPGHGGTLTLDECTEGVPPTQARHEIVSSASSAMSGTYTLSFRGEVSSDLRHDASQAEVAAALNALSTVGEVAVMRSGLAKNGYTWTVEFLTERGRLPAIVADGGGLRPADAHVAVNVVASGSDVVVACACGPGTGKGADGTCVNCAAGSASLGYPLDTSGCVSCRDWCVALPPGPDKQGSLAGKYRPNCGCAPDYYNLRATGAGPPQCSATWGYEKGYSPYYAPTAGAQYCEKCADNWQPPRDPHCLNDAPYPVSATNVPDGYSTSGQGPACPFADGAVWCPNFGGHYNGEFALDPSGAAVASAPLRPCPAGSTSNPVWSTPVPDPASSSGRSPSVAPGGAQYEAWANVDLNEPLRLALLDGRPAAEGPMPDAYCAALNAGVAYDGLEVSNCVAASAPLRAMGTNLLPAGPSVCVDVSTGFAYGYTDPSPTTERRADTTQGFDWVANRDSARCKAGTSFAGFCHDPYAITVAPEWGGPRGNWLSTNNGTTNAGPFGNPWSARTDATVYIPKLDQILKIIDVTSSSGTDYCGHLCTLDPSCVAWNWGALQYTPSDPNVCGRWVPDPVYGPNFDGSVCNVCPDCCNEEVLFMGQCDNCVALFNLMALMENPPQWCRADPGNRSDYCQLLSGFDSIGQLAGSPLGVARGVPATPSGTPALRRFDDHLGGWTDINATNALPCSAASFDPDGKSTDVMGACASSVLRDLSACNITGSAGADGREQSALYDTPGCTNAGCRVCATQWVGQLSSQISCPGGPYPGDPLDPTGCGNWGNPRQVGTGCNTIATDEAAAATYGQAFAAGVGMCYGPVQQVTGNEDSGCKADESCVGVCNFADQGAASGSEPAPVYKLGGLQVGDPDLPTEGYLTCSMGSPKGFCGMQAGRSMLLKASAARVDPGKPGGIAALDGSVCGQPNAGNGCGLSLCANCSGGKMGACAVKNADGTVQCGPMVSGRCPPPMTPCGPASVPATTRCREAVDPDTLMASFDCIPCISASDTGCERYDACRSACPAQKVELHFSWGDIRARQYAGEYIRPAVLDQPAEAHAGRYVYRRMESGAYGTAPVYLAYSSRDAVWVVCDGPDPTVATWHMHAAAPTTAASPHGMGEEAEWLLCGSPLVGGCGPNRQAATMSCAKP